MNGIEYNTLGEATKAIGPVKATFDVTADEEGDAEVPVGADYTINGNDHTVKGSIVATADVAGKTTTLSIDHLRMDGEGTRGMAIRSQNQETDPTELILTVTNSWISNYKEKGIYLTNAKSLLVDNVSFNDNATVAQTPINGDYALDVNLIGVQGAEIVVKNSTFTGKSGGNAPIKVTQRGTKDDVMDDISYYYVDGKRTDNAAASIANFTAENNDFTKVEGNKKGDIILGSSYNDDGSARTSATEFPATIIASVEKPVNVYVRSSKDVEEAKNQDGTLKYVATKVTDEYKRNDNTGADNPSEPGDDNAGDGGDEVVDNNQKDDITAEPEVTQPREEATDNDAISAPNTGVIANDNSFVMPAIIFATAITLLAGMYHLPANDWL